MKCTDTRLAKRLAAAQELFRRHHGNVEPDALFADRVIARLPSRSDAALGWAVARMLPATLALLLVLVWLSWQTIPVADPALEVSPTEDVLAWVLDRAGEDR